MTDTRSAFQKLLHTTGKYPAALAPVPLHGFLTAVALGPEIIEEERILAVVYGTPPDDGASDIAALERLTWDAIEAFIDDLDAGCFKPLLQIETGLPPNPALWVQGFNQAVTLDEPAWSALNDQSPAAGKLFAFIQSLASAELAETLFGVTAGEYDAYLAESIPLLSNALETLFHAYLEEILDLPHDVEAFDPADLPSFTREELQQLPDDRLMFYILNLGDMLPREVVNEAIRRGPSMAILLRRHLEDPSNRHVDADAWWGLLHAIFILGHITGEDAVKGLLHAVAQTHSGDDQAIWEWVGGYWPRLFSNKREQARAGLQEIACNKNLDWIVRITALECLLEGAQAAGPEALNQLLEQTARMTADEQDDMDFRLMSAMQLLNFPRDAHRALLERLAQEQLEEDPFLYFSMKDIDAAYRSGRDTPEWERFTDPLSFYDPQTILERQRRWIEEDREQADLDWLEGPDDLPYLLDDDMNDPYVRETPKIGRNDPCPCGSGKKYKKCCLKKLH